MKHAALALSLFLAPSIATTDTPPMMINDVIDGHILPRYEILSTQSQALSDAAALDCSPTSESLRTAYSDAFDAWVSASHLRFGPSETNDRAFALAFWPDSRGVTPRTLSALLADEDPIARSADAYADVSIAARGFYALEFLLYDEAIMSAGARAYHCQLVQTISADIAVLSQDILNDWLTTYADLMRTPSAEGLYRNDEEVLQQMFSALTTGLEFTADTRLGRPLGTFERPRPTRAEARRSGRSADHVRLSLTSLQDLALRLAGDNDDITDNLNSGFENALSQLSDLDDPVFAAVSAPQTRLKVEVVQQSVISLRDMARDELGPTLGVAAGFNAMDGD